MYQTVCCLCVELYFIQRVLPPWLDRTWSDVCNPATLVNIFYSRLQALSIAQLSEIRLLQISKTQDMRCLCARKSFMIGVRVILFSLEWSLLSDSAVISSEPKLWVIITVFRLCSIYSICDPGAENQSQGSIFRNWDLYIINNLSFDVWCVMIENLESENHL